MELAPNMPLATILIEDSPAIRSGLIPALAELANVEVIAVAETARDGIAALAAHAPTWRLAVVDMLLKEGNGLQVLRAAQERRSDQHVIVLTNYATQEIRRKATECGADAVFDKSTEIDTFMELCSRYSAEQGSRDAGATSAPDPGRSEGSSPDPQEASSVGELIERVSIDRLLTQAVRESVERNAASVRDHLKRQGAGPRGPQRPAAEEPGPEPKDDVPD